MKLLLLRVILPTVLLHFAFSGCRVNLSLTALSLHASPFTVGAIASMLAMLPMTFAVSAGRITAEARVINRSRTTGLVECDVRDEQNRLLARASSTCYVFTAERAEPVFRAMTSWK